MMKGSARTCKKMAVQNRVSCEEHLAKFRAAAARWRSTDKGKANRADHRAHRRGRGRFYYAQQWALRHGKEWTLTKEEFEAIGQLPCDYCGFPCNIILGVGLDRLDNARGYHADNVVSCCEDCNCARRHTFTPAEMKIIGLAIRKVKLSREALR